MKRHSISICLVVLLAVLSLPVRGQDNCKLERTRKKSSPSAVDRKIEYQVGQQPSEAESNVKVQLWAVVIGISLYKQDNQSGSGPAVSNLKYAADDAQSMYDFLLSSQGGSFPETNIKLLLDEQATKKNVEQALEWLKQAQPHDYYVFFIAAHGAIGPSNGESGEKVPYFVLHDTDPQDMPGTAIDMRVLGEMVEKKLPQKGLVICDTCHSAGVVDHSNRGVSSLSIPATPLFVKEINSLSKGVGFLLAAGQLEASKELDNLGHGVFTYCLLNALRGEADFNQDDKINFCEVGNYLVEEVPKIVADQHVLVMPNTIDANFLPLSLVSYTEDSDSHSTLLIRSPDIDGVEVAIDGKHFEKLKVGIETALMVTPKEHKLEFTRNGTVVGSLMIKPESGRFMKISIESKFAESGDSEEQIGLPVSFNLPEKQFSEKAEDLYKQGIESFDKQRFQEAIKKFDAAIKENNGVYQRALVYRGRALQSVQRYKEAVDTFTEALKLKPSDYQTETLLLEAMFDSRSNLSTDKIISKLKDIKRRYPDYFYARVVLGDVLFSRGDLRGAEQEIRYALLRYPNSPASHMILANILAYASEKSKRAEAITQAKIARDLFMKIATKEKEFKRGSLLHLILGGGRYVNEPALAEVDYILSKAYINALLIDPASANLATYIAEASKYLDESRSLAQKNSLKSRLALVYALSAQCDMLKADTTSAIKNGELALRESVTLTGDEIKCAMYPLLSQAYESNQTNRDHLLKAIENHQKYVDTCRVYMRKDSITEAQQRLDWLKAEIADRKR
jgi:hypothetical protein